MQTVSLLSYLVALVALPAEAANAGAVFHLGASGMNKVANKYLPELVAAAKGIVVPGGNSKHYSYDSFKFDTVSIGSLSVALSAPKSIVVTMSSIALSVPHTHYEVEDKVLGIKIKCGGHFWASLSGTTITSTLAINDASGLPDIPVSSTVNFGALHVDHKMDNEACKIGESIVSAFIGNINDKIKGEVEKEVPKAINSELQKEINSQVKQLSGNVSVDK